MKALTIIAWVGAGMLLAGAARVADPVGAVIALQGQATATQPGAQPRALALKGDVFLNDRIATAAGSKVQILFNDDTVVSQGENGEMTIDEYVYSPQRQQDNGFAAGMLKGAFRVITGQITKLNPDRFKVKSRLSTVGIRGCDMGFRIEEVQEYVYVMALHGDENVIVDPSGGKGEQEAKLKPVRVRRPRRVVMITAGRDLVERSYTPEEISLFIKSVTPDPGVGQLQPGPKPTGITRVTPPTRLTATMPGLQGDPLVQGGRTGVSDEPVVPPPTLTTPTLAPPPAVRRTTSSGPKFEERGRGLDWQWGVWVKRGAIVDIDVLSKSPASPADFPAAQFYGLYGQGVAAALLSGFGQQNLLEGTCNIYVYAGYQGAEPSWTGNFFMPGIVAASIVNGTGSMGDRLEFHAGGTIGPDGKMQGALIPGIYSPYVLQFNGHSYDSSTLTASGISGQLVGSGSPRQVTGAIGKYDFTHNNGEVTVKGIYGTDFSPSLGAPAASARAR